MNYKEKVWTIIAVLLVAFWILAYQAFQFVMELISVVIK